MNRLDALMTKLRAQFASLNNQDAEAITRGHDAFARATDLVDAWTATTPAAEQTSLVWCSEPRDMEVQAKPKISLTAVSKSDFFALWNADSSPASKSFVAELVVDEAPAQATTVTFGIVPSKPDEHPEGLCRCPACFGPRDEDATNGLSPQVGAGEAAPGGDSGPSMIGTYPTLFEVADAAANNTTAYTLLVGDSAQGTINANGDRDWYAVTLDAGITYTFALVGTGTNNVIDPYLRLYDTTGTTELAFNDDSLPNNNSIFTYTPLFSGTYYVSAGSFDDIGTGQYGVTVAAGTRPSFDMVMGAGAIDADRSWSTPGTGAVVTYAFRASPATYTVDGSNIATFTQLTATQIDAVRATLQAWSEVSGITFVEVNPGGYSDNATILFGNYTDNDGAGAFAFYPGSTASTASAGDVWLNTNSIPTGSVISPGGYAYHAIMHEIGHAIGLSHPGTYNAGVGQTITYAANAQFREDTHQYTTMSYFDEGNTGALFFGYNETAMLLDIYAAQQIYGANNATRASNSTYGFNSNLGGIYDFTTNTVPVFTIWDAGGTDTIDASGFAQNQTIDLNEGKFSTIGSATQNIAIALGVTIENAIGGSGGDTIHGNNAANRLEGNAGIDTLNGNDGDDILIGGAGGDTINGGNGTDDLASYETSALGVNIDLQVGSASGGDAAGDAITGVESLAGSNQNDQLFGNANANRLIGNGGADFIQGRGGSDNIQGGDGDDWLDGGAGGDVIDGGNGVLDVAAYGSSPSGVNLDLQANTFTGGDATGDTLTNVEGVSGSAFADQLFGNASANRLFGQGGADFIQGRGGNDIIDGGDGDDWLDGGAGADQIFGGAGTNDIVAYGASASAINADLAAFTFTGGDAAGDTYSGVEGVSGSSFNDQIFGDANANRLFGQGGNDFIQGRGGNDIIDGGDGDDWLDGGAGADQIFGGAGTNDVVAYGASLAAVNIDLGAFTFSGGDATGDTYSGVEGVSGSSFGDQLFGNGSANRLFGQGGADFIQGRGGNDVIDGGDGDDWLDGGAGGDQIFGGAGTNDVVAYGSSLAAVTVDMAAFSFSGGDATGDTYSGIEGVSGSSLNDQISGNASANRLYGQAGIDILAGRGGNDQLYGGNDNDTFVFADNGDTDTIFDFDDFGDDVIQLSIAGITDFTGVQAVMTQVGADVLIDFATTDILLVNTTLASMGSDDFTFV